MPKPKQTRDCSVTLIYYCEQEDEAPIGDHSTMLTNANCVFIVVTMTMTLQYETIPQR